MSTGPKKPLEITPDWTLERLKQECPGVELTLYSHFGIGSRERAGFIGSELLSDLLRRHMVFDAERACHRLTELAQEDQRHSLSCHQLSLELSRGTTVVVDARSEQEYLWSHLPGALLLSKETVERLQGDSSIEPVAVCRDGSQSPAAARILRAQGLDARYLRGGLEAWSWGIDSEFPILFPLVEKPGHWYLLADGETLRFRRRQKIDSIGFRIIQRSDLNEFTLGQELLRKLPQIEMVIATPRSFAVRGLAGELHQVIRSFPPEVRNSPQWQDRGELGDEMRECELLDQVLAHEAPAILANHKGTVEVQDYSDRILTLALGGGCAGCASSQITTQRELAASLYRAVPLLDSILS
jgi:rhodanese-related sulfurtransferase/Fe-S cluster biogenesis protein NfuA